MNELIRRNEDIRHNIVTLEQRINEAKREHNIPDPECPVTHVFAPGSYARTIFIPAGTVLTGAIHKEEGFFIIRKGELLVTVGDDVVRVGAGYMGITAKGEKRAGFAVSDVLFTTFHANPKEIREEKEIWAEFTIPANLLEEQP